MTLNLTQGMTQKLDALDSEFRTHHHTLIDFIDDEEALLMEQKTLNYLDDFVAELSACIQQLVNAWTTLSDMSFGKIAVIMSSEEESMDICVSCISMSKKEHTDIQNSLLACDLVKTDELSMLQASLEGQIFLN